MPIQPRRSTAMAMRSQTQRALLFSFIASIAACGLVGIYCLLLGNMGWYSERILGTTSAIGAASILGLAAAVPWERRRWHPVGLLGLLAVAAALVLVIVAIWSTFRVWDDYYKVMFTACVLAVALPHIGLLSLARLRREYEWVRIAGVVVIALLAGQIIVSILAEIDDDVWFRGMGILAIMDVCATITVPILHRISAIRVHEAIRTVELALSLTCPRCAQTQKLPVGRSKCAGCGLKFSIEIEEEHCPTCGYALYKLESAVCPECGTPLVKSDET